MNATFRRLRRMPRRSWAALAALLWAFSACNLSDDPAAHHFIGIRLPDSVQVGDSVQALLRLPADTTRMDTLWDGPLLSDTSLDKLPAPHYRGGDADLFVSAWARGNLFYQVRVSFRAGLAEPAVMAFLPRDSLAPTLSWEGPDSLDLPDLPADSALESLFPGMRCVDDRDRAVLLPTLRFREDSTRAGMGWIEYGCRDRAGNAMPPRLRRLRLLARLDTVAPNILYGSQDTLVTWLGHAINLAKAYCVDDRDPAPRLRDSGTVDAGTLGDYPIRYECVDASGNLARRLRVVRVVREPDTVKPVLTRHGPDTVLVLEGDGFRDTARVECLDDRDGKLPPYLKGTDPGTILKRGEYDLDYRCLDSAGNMAILPLVAKVIRRPDPVPPVLTLRGPDSLVLYDGDAYADSGAVCVDDRDGILPVETHNPVDTRKRGEYEVAFACADSAGNPAAAKRKVRVMRKPDAAAPVLLLRGPDTALVYDHEPYRDSGAVCMDARDGMLAVRVEGAIDTAKRGLQALAFACADSAGNSARIQRMVKVARRPDAVRPVIALRGPDSLQTWQGYPYADSGAVCTDDRDGTLPTQTFGSIDTGVRGLQALVFQCTDSAGNLASRPRKVLVIRAPDSTAPALSLRGPDSIAVWQGTAYSDSGAVCADDRDGALPIQQTGSVNTAVRGLYSLGFKCADSVGNQASRTRKVKVIRVPDAVPPILGLRGPDSLDVWQGTTYVDSGASCADARDGALPIQISGSVNTAARGLQLLSFQCADSAGNVASRVRKVRVIRVPDAVKPVITLRGPAALVHPIGQPYVDSGATCADDRDGPLPVQVQGSVVESSAGDYPLSYACSDSAGNAAVKATRTVKVRLPGTFDPVITLAGPDTQLVVSAAGYIEFGGACKDAVGASLSLTAEGITPAVTGPGWYQARYSCKDGQGNASTATRVLKVGPVGTALPPIADAQLDTLNNWANCGACGSLGFSEEPNAQYFALVRFDLAKAGKAGLKSAKLRFLTFQRDVANIGGFRKLTFEVYRITSDWVEGTGDWFYHDGGYRNSGETWYKNYPVSDSMKAIITNPATPSGVTGASTGIIPGLIKVSTVSDSVYYPPFSAASSFIPVPDQLIPIELDITDYVSTADPAQAFGFVVRIKGNDGKSRLGFASREAGGGKVAPLLLLEY